MLGQLLSVVGKKEEAIQVLEIAKEQNPDSVVLALNLANQYAELERYEEGIQVLEDVLKQVPGDTGAQTNILRMLSDNKRNKEAIERGAQWLKEKPSSTLQAILGVILVRDHQYKLAKEILTASLEDEIPREHVHRSLGHIALIEERTSQAIEEYERELRL